MDGDLDIRSNTPLLSLNNSVFQKIYERLDIGSAWRDLAATMHGTIFKLSDIQVEKCARALHTGQSPSKLLLEIWDNQGMTVEVLGHYLEQLRLDDCLKFIKQPEPLQIIVQPQKEIQVNCGEDIELFCEAVGFPYPQYVWFKNKQKLIVDNKSGFLIVTNADPTDSGVYVCRIQHFTNKNGWHYLFSSPCRVTVIGTPRNLRSFSALSHAEQLENMNSMLSDLPPEIVLQPTNLTSDLGGIAIFRVEARHKTDNLSYQWFYNSMPIPNANSNELRIDDLRKEDSGSYQALVCSTRNEKIQALSKEVKLEVKPKPNQFTAGDKVALVIGNSTYRSYGQPLPAVKNDLWFTVSLFERMKFKVIALLDLTLDEMKRAVDYFCQLISQETYAVFYCMGHGFLYDKKHFLIPWDSKLGNDVSESLCIESCVKQIQRRGPRMFMVLIDHCRKQVEHSQVEEIPEESIDMSLPNYVIIYAAITGEEAYEIRGSGKGDKIPRGLFNLFLLQVLEKPFITVSDMYGALQIKFRECTYDRVRFPQHPEMGITLQDPERSLWDPIFIRCPESRLKELSLWQKFHVTPGNLNIPLINQGVIVLSFEKRLSNVLVMTVSITSCGNRIEVELLQDRVDPVLKPIEFSVCDNIQTYSFVNLQRLKNKLTICLNIIVTPANQQQVIKLETELINLERPLVSSLNWN